MVDKGIRDGICHTIYQQIEDYNKCMKNYDKNRESSYLKYWDVNDFHGWAMSQKLTVNDFKWVEEISQFNEDIIKIYNEDNDIGYFIETDVHYSK